MTTYKPIGKVKSIKLKKNSCCENDNGNGYKCVTTQKKEIHFVQTYNWLCIKCFWFTWWCILIPFWNKFEFFNLKNIYFKNILRIFLNKQSPKEATLAYVSMFWLGCINVQSFVMPLTIHYICFPTSPNTRRNFLNTFTPSSLFQKFKKPK
jgi:hypothetical protein